MSRKISRDIIAVPFLPEFRESETTTSRRRAFSRASCEKLVEDKVSSDAAYVRSMQALVARARLALY